MATGKIENGDYTIEDENGNLVIKDSTGTTVLTHTDGGDWSYGANVDHGGNDVTNVGALGTERLSDTIHVITEYDGGTLNAKWDNLRANLNAGEPYATIIPPGTGDETATDADGRWQVDSPLQFTNVENRGRIYAFGSFIEASANITNLVEISDGTNKPEGIEFYGGEWCAGDQTLTSIFYSDGLSDCVWVGTNVNLFGTGSVQFGFDVDSSAGAVSDNRWLDIEANSISDTALKIENAGNGVTRNYAEWIVSGGGATQADHVISYIGDVNTGTFSNVVSKAGATDVVLLATNSTGFPIEIDVTNVFSEDGACLKTEDRTSGSAPKMRVITAENLHGQVNGPNVDLAYLIQSDIAVAGQFGPEVVVASDCQDINIDTLRGVDITNSISSSATRITLNDVGENDGDPSTTGEWNGNGYEGAVVVDTTNGVAYHYRGGAWV